MSDWVLARGRGLLGLAVPVGWRSERNSPFFGSLPEIRPPVMRSTAFLRVNLYLALPCGRARHRGGILRVWWWI